MAKLKKPDQKILELKRTGTLNPYPDSVSDSLFQENPFFDPKDLLQVRYEMLRRHSVEGISIVDVATRFGVFAPDCLSGPGCIPANGPERPASQAPRSQRRAQTIFRGSRVCAGASNRRAHFDDGGLCPSCSGKVGIRIHRRSLERALASKKKPRIPT